MNLNKAKAVKHLEEKLSSTYVNTENLHKESTIFYTCFNCEDGKVFFIYKEGNVVCSQCSHENNIQSNS